ncbi:MAG: photosynthetic complex putative assembly protein PuhB [Sulfitobacter sp.]|nr:photosynthetic complex putative assembly protein PuhB [Sulfitobacter sp.]MDG1354490.1 photosynthetic complex putative assembly protein PuhB [Sulfitobacter sp.]
MHHDDFNFEPVRGLPEALPADEHILWQGAPDPMRLAIEAWKMHWIIGYFAVLAVWRVGISSLSVPMPVALSHAIAFVLSAIAACVVVYIMATVQARSTVYTLTNKRAALRIGAALTMTLNLPYVCIGNAAVQTRRNGTGTLSFELIDDTRVSYMMTWPHARPWSLRRVQPAFRCIPDVGRVAAIFAEAAETRVHTPRIEKLDPAHSAPGAVAAE